MYIQGLSRKNSVKNASIFCATWLDAFWTAWARTRMRVCVHVLDL